MSRKVVSDQLKLKPNIEIMCFLSNTYIGFQGRARLCCVMKGKARHVFCACTLGVQMGGHRLLDKDDRSFWHLV